MPQPHQPDPSSPPPPSSPPACGRCGKPMRLIGVVPYLRYTNIDLCHYLCECGKGDGFFVARRE
ncbi:MAG: hypothetical protein ABWZ64_17990 [Xanthobacteraceae bacterium]